MHTIHYLTTLLIIATLQFCGFSGKAQNNQDTIRMVNKGLGYAFYQNDKLLNFKQLKSITGLNKEAFRLIDAASVMRGASYVFGCIGGFSAGFVSKVFLTQRAQRFTQGAQRFNFKRFILSDHSEKSLRSLR